MSATFNWAYKPSVTNKYGVTINSSLDDVKPSNACYVALFGDDTTGNGSRQKPYRTLAFALGNTPGNGYLIIASGTYREGDIHGTALSSKVLLGDGDVTIDFSYYNSFFADDGISAYHPKNIKFIGNTTNGVCRNGAGTQMAAVDCIFDSCVHSLNGNFISNTLTIQNCVFRNIAVNMNMNSAIIRNCTFYNNNSINFTATQIPDVRSAIFYKCNINFNGGSIYPSYSLFYQCNFRFTSSGQSGGALYPSMPSGYTYISDIATLRSNYTAAYPAISNPVPNCIITDPKFNNVPIGDVTLAFDSPAKNLSYFGTYVGAYSISQSIKARSDSSIGDFDFLSAVNLTIEDDSITLTNPALDGQIETKPVINLLAREIARFPSYGFNADRNAQYIDSIADLSNTIYAAGDTLPANMPFVVENGAITYNGAIIQAGDRGTTVTAATTFTTVAGGSMREILEAPQRHTIMARFSDGGDFISASDNLSDGYYYFVISGSVDYSGDTINEGSVFKATGTTPFSGSGSVKVALSTEEYQHYEPGIKPTSNNVGDNRTGTIVRGNGDPSYDRGGLGVKEFPINAKFIQIKYVIRVNNLKP